MTRHIRSHVVNDKRPCTKCGKTKPLEEFYKKVRRFYYRRGTNTCDSDRMSECKDCFRSRMRDRTARKKIRVVVKLLDPSPVPVTFTKS